MSLKNKEVMQLINNNTKEMEKHLNVVEEEVQKSDEKFNRAIVAMSIGKIMKLHQQVSYYLGIYDDNPKYLG